MREISIILSIMFSCGVAHASDGQLDGKELLYNFKLLIGIGLFGVIGSSLVSLFGNAKVAGLITKVSYFAGFVVFLTIATTLIDRFVTIYNKIEKIVG